MLLLDHLSEADKTYVLDKAAMYLAQILADQKQSATVYRGQKAIAERLGCKRETVAALLSSGRLRCTLLGKKGYQTTEEAILAYQRAAT